MAWSKAGWSRSVGSFLHRPSELLGTLGAASTWPSMAKRDVGTIPLGETEGVHVLAVYLPKPGVVLAQMHVEHKGMRITFAPTWLHQMDVRGVVGSLDAMCDRRAPPSEDHPSAGGLCLDGECQ